MCANSTSTKTLSHHPVAEIFPMMDDEQYEALKADIAEQGVQSSGLLYQGKVLDGRNRYRACQELGIEMDWMEVELGEDADSFDPLQYVLTHNLHRRHLSTSQRAMVAARARDIYDKQAKERQKRKPAGSVPENLPEQKTDARDAAGKAVGVSGKSVDFATTVIERGSEELQRAVDAGEVSVSKAAKSITKANTEKQEQPLHERRDRVGNVLTYEQEQVFDYGLFIGNIVRKLKEATNRASHVKKTPAGNFLNLRRFRAVIKEAESLLNATVPFAVCPYCEGRKCMTCGETGMVPKEVYEGWKAKNEKPGTTTKTRTNGNSKVVGKKREAAGQ